jgi:hypothetical protein
MAHVFSLTARRERRQFLAMLGAASKLPAIWHNTFFFRIFVEPIDGFLNFANTCYV